KKETEPTHWWAYLIDENSTLPLNWSTKAAGRLYTHAPNLQGVNKAYRAAVRVPGTLIAVSDLVRVRPEDPCPRQQGPAARSRPALWRRLRVGCAALADDAEVPSRRRAKRAINAVLKGGGKP